MGTVPRYQQIRVPNEVISVVHEPSGLESFESRVASSPVDSSLGITRLEPARVHWRAGSILLASGSNRGPRADSIPLAARFRLDSLGSRLEQGSTSGLESLGSNVAYRSNHRNLRLLQLHTSYSTGTSAYLLPLPSCILPRD